MNRKDNPSVGFADSSLYTRAPVLDYLYRPSHVSCADTFPNGGGFVGFPLGEAVAIATDEGNIFTKKD